MFCSRCGTEATDSAVFCSKCGQELAGSLNESAPATPSTTGQAPPTVVVNANPYGTPGTGALWLSIFGFVCLIPAVLGIIFGFSALSEAKRRGVSGVKAGWAIAIGFAWIVPVAAIWIFAFSGVESSTSSTTQTSTSSETLPEAAPTVVDEVAPAQLEALVDELKGSGFDCIGPRGTLQVVQCTKGEVEVEPYGPTPVQTINIEYSSGSVNGYAKAKILTLVSQYISVDEAGDDGSGTGAILFGSS